MDQAPSARRPARYRPTVEECRRGGQAAAARLTREQRRRGGRARAAQPSFRLLQQARGRAGARTTRARYGAAYLAEKLAAYRRAHPTRPEAFVAAVLAVIGLPYEREKVVPLGATCARCDFAVPAWAIDPAAPGPGYYVLEPGDRRWHGGPAESWDGADHARGRRGAGRRARRGGLPRAAPGRRGDRGGAGHGRGAHLRLPADRAPALGDISLQPAARAGSGRVRPPRHLPARLRPAGGSAALDSRAPRCTIGTIAAAARGACRAHHTNAR